MKNKKIFLNTKNDRIMNKRMDGENITFLRSVDGKRVIMTGQAVSAQEDGWASLNYVRMLDEYEYGPLMRAEMLEFASRHPCTWKEKH